MNLIRFRSLDSIKQTGPLCMWPGNQETKRELTNLPKAERQASVPYIPFNDRKWHNNKLDPSLREYLGWLSLHWTEHLTESQNSERQQPVSYSSWSSSPTWWSLSSSDINWQNWHSNGRQIENGQTNGEEGQCRTHTMTSGNSSEWARSWTLSKSTLQFSKKKMSSLRHVPVRYDYSLSYLLSVTTLRLVNSFGWNEKSLPRLCSMEWSLVVLSIRLQTLPVEREKELDIVKCTNSVWNAKSTSLPETESWIDLNKETAQLRRRLFESEADMDIRNWEEDILILLLMKPTENPNLKEWSSIRRPNGLLRLKERRLNNADNWQKKTIPKSRQKLSRSWGIDCARQFASDELFLQQERDASTTSEFCCRTRRLSRPT